MFFAFDGGHELLISISNEQARGTQTNPAT